MMESLISAVDFLLFASLFYLFMSRTGKKRFHSNWLYMAAYTLFVLGCYAATSSGSIVVMYSATMGLVILLEILMYQNRFTGFVLSLIYTAGILISQTFCSSFLFWLYRNMTVIHVLSIGAENPDTQIITSYFLKWFAEVVWTFSILTVLRRDDAESEELLSGKQYVLFILLPVFSMIYLCSILVMSSEIFVIRYGYWPVLVNVILVFAMNLLFLYFFRSVQKGHRAQREQNLYRQEAELLYQHYQKLEESYRASRKVIHDAKNHMQAVARLYECGETERAKGYAQDVFHLLNQTGQTWYTDNRMLNIILNEKLGQEEVRQARLELDIEEGSLDRITEIHITTIFANLLDNAVEAMGTDEDAYLSLQVKNVHDFLVIHITNSIGQSRKPSAGHQKLGLKNVRSALEPYNGTMNVSREDGRFSVSIMIPK